jgi:hypothetical protein
MFNGCSLDQHLEKISSIGYRKLKARESSFVFDQTRIHSQLHLRLRQNGNIWEERKVRITTSLPNVIMDNVISQIIFSVNGSFRKSHQMPCSIVNSNWLLLSFDNA